jgi:trehalose/maltose transport system permease protein
VSVERRTAVLFLAPLLAFVGLFILVPVAGTLADSLLRDLVYRPVRFVALANYAALADDPAFGQALRFTALFTVVSVPLELGLGLGIALVLNEPLRLRGLLRACVLLPWAIPAAVSGRLFKLIYDYGHGAANALLGLLHLSDGPVSWLGTGAGAFAAILVADAWKTTPFVAILLLAGLSLIPEDLVRQARVDRAGLVQRFVHVTLPLLRPVIVVTLLFRTIEALRVFDVVYVLTGGGPGGSTTSLSLYAYESLASGDFGYGSAASVVLFGLALALAVLCVRLGRFSEVLS